jgi:glucosamine--fructose-6-phosphate aminotransferase (isomerizing)
MSDSYLKTEILEQPAVLQRLLEVERPSVERISAAIRQAAPRYVMLVARGSSDNAARYGQYLFGAVNGLPVALAAPALYTLYQRPPRLDGALVLAISQSGQSPDIVAVVEEGRRQGALTVAITNEPASPLAGAAQHTIALQAGPERSLAATKTYTASLMALALLSTALAGDASHTQSLQAVPGFVAEVLASAPAILQAAERYRYMDACVVASRGYNYATAFEITLKLKELAYVLAEPYSLADFRHGPMAVVERDFPVVTIVPEGVMAAGLLEFLRQLRERQAEIVVISALDEALAMAQTPLVLPRGMPEWISPLAAVVAGQIFAMGLTQAKGLDPDHPRGLRKVTLTR